MVFSDGACSAVAGAGAGALGALMLQPLDVLTTQLIQQSKQSPLRTTQIASAIVRQHGVRGLWKGTGPAVVRVSGGAGVYFSVLSFIYPSCKPSSASSLSGRLEISSAPVAGVIARVIAAIAMCPVTLVKTRCEAGAAGSVEVSALRHWRMLVEREGWRSLYKGLVPLLLRDMPYSALSLTFYVSSKDYLVRSGAQGGWVDFVAGCVAGAGATAITHPGEVLRVRLQVDQRNLGMCDALLGIWKNEGLFAFFKGYGPRILRRGLSNSVSWGFYGVFFTAMKSL